MYKVWADLKQCSPFPFITREFSSFTNPMEKVKFLGNIKLGIGRPYLGTYLGISLILDTVFRVQIQTQGTFVQNQRNIWLRWKGKFPEEEAKM